MNRMKKVSLINVIYRQIFLFNLQINSPDILQDLILQNLDFLSYHQNITLQENMNRVALIICYLLDSNEINDERN